MIRKKLLRKSVSLMLLLALAASLGACGDKDKSSATADRPVRKEKESDEKIDRTDTALSDLEMESLMEQVAKSDVSKNYEDYLKEDVFANAEVFGIDIKNSNGSAYVYLNEGEYVVLKDKAYKMSGSSGEAIIRFKSTGNTITLSKVVWSDDGEGHETWVEENFPEEYYERLQGMTDEKRDNLEKVMEEDVKVRLGVTVEKENLLQLDPESGTYDIVKPLESGEGDDYSFDTETIETGNLKDL